MVLHSLTSVPEAGLPDAGLTLPRSHCAPPAAQPRHCRRGNRSARCASLRLRKDSWRGLASPSVHRGLAPVSQGRCSRATAATSSLWASPPASERALGCPGARVRGPTSPPLKPLLQPPQQLQRRGSLLCPSFPTHTPPVTWQAPPAAPSHLTPTTHPSPSQGCLAWALGEETHTCLTGNLSRALRARPSSSHVHTPGPADKH